MGNTEQNRRRNQIIAQRSAEKVMRETLASSDPSEELWAEIDAELARTIKTHAFMGNAGNACRSARALLALRELKARGVQLKLF